MSQLQAVSAALQRMGSSARRLVPVLEDKVGPRWTPTVLAILVWLFAVLLLTLVFSNPTPAAPGHRFGVLLLDRWATAMPYPLTVQNLQHLLLAVGLGELWVCWQRADAEMDLLEQGYLPEDEQTMLQAEDLGAIRHRLLGHFDADSGHLAAMIDLCVLQFFASRSVEQAISVLGHKQALIQHQVASSYRRTRYPAWAIATVGLAGTLASLGAAFALTTDGPARQAALAGAFDAGVVGLLEAGLLLLLAGIAQSREERAVNLSGRYVLHNLINRLYAGRAAA